jgi:flagellar protein FliL
MADSDAEGTKTAQPKGKSKKTRLLLAVVLLAGAAGGYVLKGGGAGEEPAGASATTAPPKPGAMVDIEPLSLNLADGRYLRVGVAVQLVDGEGGEAEEWLAEHGPVIRDLLIQQLGGAYVADLATAEGREAVRTALLEKADEHLDDDLYALYFTEFVMQ